MKLLKKSSYHVLLWLNYIVYRNPIVTMNFESQVIDIIENHWSGVPSNLIAKQLSGICKNILYLM